MKSVMEPTVASGAYGVEPSGGGPAKASTPSPAVIQTGSGRRDRSLLSLMILAGFALRLYNIDAQSLWYDETVSAFLAGQAPADLIAHTARDIHPPGYYLLLHFWTRVAGHTQFALAFCSLIFGLLLIPLTYLLSRTLAGRRIAAWAAFLVAISPYHLWYSQEVRMYTWGAALGLLATIYLLKALTARPAWPYWLGYAVAAALGLYSLYYFAFLLLILNLIWLIYLVRHKPALLKPFLLANLLAALAYLPWLPVAWRQATNPPVPPWRALPQFWPMLVEGWTALSLGQSVEPASVWPVLLLTFSLLLLGIFYLKTIYSPHRFPRTGLLFAYIFGPWLLIYLLSLITPLYHVRYLFTYSPAFYILLAAGLAWLSVRARWLAAGAVGLLLAASGYSVYQFHFNPRYQTDDYRAAVRFIQDRWQPGDVIMVNAGYVYTAFLYYADALPPLQRQRLAPYRSAQPAEMPLLLQTGTVDGEAQLGWGDPQSDFYAMSAAETVAALEQMSQEFARLWLLRAYDTVTDPSGLIRRWLAENSIPLEDQLFPGESNIRVQGFLLPGAPPPPNPPVDFEDGMVLAGWRLPGQIWQPGQIVRLKLWWSVAARPAVDYKMSLKLWNPGGELAAQGQDQWPVGSLYRATMWPPGQIVYQPAALQLPSDLPPGQYWLNVELYHPETIQPLARKDNGEHIVTLGPVTVESHSR